jgi:type IV secretion system protein VirB2
MNISGTYLLRDARFQIITKVSQTLLFQSSLVLVATISASTVAAAATAGPNMPWETPLQTVADSITGPVAKAIGVIAIATTGLGFAFSEGGSVVRRGLGIVFGLAIAFTASTFLTSFFTLTTGAVVP